MIHKGKLPPIVVGELQHVLNNALGPIMLIAAQVGGPDGERIEKAVMKIAEYVKSLEHKTEFSNAPFTDYKGAA